MRESPYAKSRRVRSVHVPELTVDGDERDVDAVRGDGLGYALNPPRSPAW
jgi:hypothetical protein